jgi:hypothetical protein
VGGDLLGLLLLHLLRDLLELSLQFGSFGGELIGWLARLSFNSWGFRAGLLHVLDNAAADLDSLSFSALGVDLVDSELQPGELAHHAHQRWDQNEPHSHSEESLEFTVVAAAVFALASLVVVFALVVVTTLVMVIIMAVTASLPVAALVMVIVMASEVSATVLIFIEESDIMLLGLIVLTAKLVHLFHLLVEMVTAVELSDAEHGSEEDQESDLAQGAVVFTPVLVLGLLWVLKGDEGSEEHQNPLNKCEEVQSVEVVLQLLLRGWGRALVTTSLLEAVLTVESLGGGLFVPAVIDRWFVLVILEIEAVPLLAFLLALSVGILRPGWGRPHKVVHDTVRPVVMAVSVLITTMLRAHRRPFFKVRGSNNEWEQTESNASDGNRSHNLGAFRKTVLDLLKSLLLVDQLVDKSVLIILLLLNVLGCSWCWEHHWVRLILHDGRGWAHFHP